MTIGMTTDDYRGIPISWSLRVLRWRGIRFSETTVNLLRAGDGAIRLPAGLNVGLHLPTFGSFGYDFSFSNRRSQIEPILRSIQANKALFQYIVFHPLESGSQYSSIAFYLEILSRLSVPLVLENTIGYDSDRFLKCGEFFRRNLGKNFWGFCLDIPHAVLSGENWVTFYKEVSPDIRLIHLSDGSGDFDSHLPFGSGGKFHLREICEVIRGNRYNGFLNFELNPPSFLHLNAVFKTCFFAENFFSSPSVQLPVD